MKQLLALTTAFLIGSFALAAPRALDKTKEGKLLSMLFENPNRKTLTEAKDCKVQGPQRAWACDHKTVKTVLASALYMGVPGDRYAKQSKLECEPITKEMKASVLKQVGWHLGPVAFRREVVQSLDGQWVCTFEAAMTPYEEMVRAKEEELKAQQVTSTAPAVDGAIHDLHLTRPAVEVHRSVFGLTFIMNRDQSRIVSRNIVAWSNF